MRGTVLGAGLAAVAFLVVGRASADTIDFGQFGPDGTVLANTLTGVTVGGVDFTIIGPDNGFLRVDANTPDWTQSEFPVGANLVYDLPGSGPVTIDFSTPISSITSLAAEPLNLGTYIATLTAYDGLTEIGSARYSSTTPGAPGSIPTLNFSAPSITSIVIDTTNDSAGFALGTVVAASVPEPSTWALLLCGFAGLRAAAGASRAMKLRAKPRQGSTR
jgi:hypothetical protein